MSTLPSSRSSPNQASDHQTWHQRRQGNGSGANWWILALGDGVIPQRDCDAGHLQQLPRHLDDLATRTAGRDWSGATPTGHPYPSGYATPRGKAVGLPPPFQNLGGVGLGVASGVPRAGRVFRVDWGCRFRWSGSLSKCQAGRRREALARCGCSGDHSFIAPCHFSRVAIPRGHFHVYVHYPYGPQGLGQRRY